ncbi:MAG: ATP-binding protein [Saprospiraceae bacterium]|nr:ATP-binding protein [Saprospiraceae bacterium]
MVYADRTLLTSALNNLIKNAIQAIPDDRNGLVRVSLFRRQNTAVLRISDNGTGIPKEIQDKILVQILRPKPTAVALACSLQKILCNPSTEKSIFKALKMKERIFILS